MPIFAEGPNRTLSGFVTIDLESPETIQSLTLAVRGRTITGANEGGMHLFLDHIVPLWSKDQGDPHAYAYRTGLDSSSPPRSPPGRSSKLFGTYSFPFSFYLPTAFDSGPWGAGALPESFHERSSGVRVQYELVLKIGRGKLRTDAKLQVPIFYCRKIAPSAASELRQAAYRDNTTPPGPDIDPYGWSTFSPVDCIGSLLNSRTVVLRCTLSLATPLSYTRGSFISCHLRIESVDEQALDFLASPRSTILRLCRRIRYMHDSGYGMQRNRTSLASRPKYEVSDVGQAIWQHEEDENDSSDSHIRYLIGEIQLLKDLPPSSDIVPFGVEYTVALLPFESAAFLPSGQTPTLLQTQKVEIVTEFAHGPGPVLIAPRASANRRADATWAPPNNREEDIMDAALNNAFTSMHGMSLWASH